MRLTSQDIAHLRTGALFLACAADHDMCHEQTDRTLAHMARHGVECDLRPVDDFDEGALIVALGFVNSGLPLSDIQPVGDEFLTSLRRVEDAVGRPAEGLMPLAAANINSLVPVLSGLQTGLPVVDADPMGRVFPLLHQSVFTLAGLPAGPLGATGPTGDSALIEVEDAVRAERLVRALAGEFGGWSATALYPMEASTLAHHGILGSVSRMIRIGEVLDSASSTEEKHARLRREEGVRQIIRARVVDVAGLSRPAPPGQPDAPSSVVLTEVGQGRLVQMEIQNELLMVMVDGAVVAVMPDIITLLRPEDASVAGLEDLWVGNTLDITVLPGPAPWYSERGIDLVGPDALHLWLRSRGGER